MQPPFIPKQNAWLTANEIAFLRGLGKNPALCISKKEMLQRYMASMSKRQDWGTMHVGEIRQELREMLKEEEEPTRLRKKTKV